MALLLDVLLVLMLVLLLYTWLVYPVWVMRCRRERPVSLPGAEGGGRPRVAVLISAYNEESQIGERVANLAAQDYPRERMVVHLGIEASEDRTAAVALAAAAGLDWVRVHPFAVRRGKVSVLKDLVSQALEPLPGAARPEVLVFTDANTHFRLDAISKLVRHFADPAVGGVCGELVFVQAGAAGGVREPARENAYWRWEKRLKQAESRLDSCLGANGGIFAMRPELFWRGIPGNTAVEDFVIGMKVREQGFRMLYAPEAVAEEALPDVQSEWGRRVRIGSGDYQALWLCRRCLLPRHGRFAWSFWSHKTLRWLTPQLVGVAALGAVIRLSLGAGWGWWLAAGYILFVAGSLSGLVLHRVTGGWPWVPCRGFLALVDHFITMQTALFAGFLRFCRGRVTGYWARTPRGANSQQGNGEHPTERRTSNRERGTSNGTANIQQRNFEHPTERPTSNAER